MIKGFTPLFEEFWKLNQVGSKEIVLAHWQSAQYDDKLTEEALLENYKRYLDMCKSEKRESRFIKTPTNFLVDKMYLSEHNKVSGSTMNFIEKWLEGYL